MPSTLNQNPSLLGFLLDSLRLSFLEDRLCEAKFLNFVQRLLKNVNVNEQKNMSTSKRSKRLHRQKSSAPEDDAAEAAVRPGAAEQTDPLDGRRSGVNPPTESSHHREETSARDRHTVRARTVNHGQPEASSSASSDANNQEAGSKQGLCDDIPTFMVPGRIVQTAYPVRFQGTVLNIPTGGFLRPQRLLQKMRSEEWRFKGC